MPHDPTGRYKGNRFDPDYVAKRKWRQDQWQDSPQGQESSASRYASSPASPASYQSPSDMDPNSDRSRPFGPACGGEAPGFDFYNNMMSHDLNTASFPDRPPMGGSRYLGNGSYSVNPGFPQQFPQEYYHQGPGASPTMPSGRMVEGRLDFPMSTDPSPPSFVPVPRNNDNRVPPPALSLSSTINADNMAPPQATPATASPSIATTATPTGELSSLEKLKLFKAQVEATRRSAQQQQQQEQLQLQQQQPPLHVDTARAFLLNVSASGTPPSEAGLSFGNADTTHQAPSVPTAPPSATTPSGPSTSHPGANASSDAHASSLDGEGGEIADTREARAQALKEKLRLKLSQKAATTDATSARRSPAPPAQQAPQPTSVSNDRPTVNTVVDRRPQEDVRMEDARPNEHNAQEPHPTRDITPDVRPESRPESRPEQRIESRFDQPPRRNFAEEARQRFASRERRERERPSPERQQRPDYRLERREPSRMRSPSPARRVPSPRRPTSERHASPAPRSRRTPPPPAREAYPPASRYDRSTPSSEYDPERQRQYERRLSNSSVNERRVYERQPPPSHHGGAAEAHSHSYAERSREREQVRDAQVIPPPGRPQAYAEHRPAAPAPGLDDIPPIAASPMEAYAVNQIALLRKQISDLEALVRSGALRPVVPVPPPIPTAQPTAPTAASAHHTEYRQEYRESRPEARPEQRLETRLEHRLDPRTPAFEPRPHSVREPSPAPYAHSRGHASPPPPARAYEERERPPPGVHGKPPFGQKEYDYGETQREYRSTPTKDASYGKTTAYKSYANNRQNKPYDKPYDKRSYEPNGRDPAPRSPPQPRYASASTGLRMERHGSWDSRAPKKYDAGYVPY